MSQSQYGYFDDDPQPAMLRQIPDDHTDVIIENLGRLTGVLYWFAISAIEDKVQDDDKDIVIANLRAKQDLVKAVRKKNWEKDAATVLISGLRAHPSYLPTEWIECIARLNDPTTYNELKWYFQNNNAFYQTFGSIYETCDVDISAEMSARWAVEKVKPVVPGAHDHFEIIAMTCNIPDALDRVMTEEWCPMFQLPTKGYTFQQIVLRHVDAKGTEAELKEWYRQNKSQIYFDKDSRKWRVKKEGQ